MATIEMLNDDVLENIFKHLPKHVVGLKVSLVCKLWRDIARSDLVWQSLYVRDLGIPVTESEGSWMERYKQDGIIQLIFGSISYSIVRKFFGMG